MLRQLLAERLLNQLLPLGLTLLWLAAAQSAVPRQVRRHLSIIVINPCRMLTGRWAAAAAARQLQGQCGLFWRLSTSLITLHGSGWIVHIRLSKASRAPPVPKIFLLFIIIM